MTVLRHQRVRVYWAVRSAHLERAREMTPASIVYRSERYDFAAELADGLDLHPVSLPRMIGLLARADVRWLEVNEPLLLSGQLQTTLAVLTVRMAAMVRRRPVEIVTYAIENRDPWPDTPPMGPKDRLRRLALRVTARVVARNVDRIVFGTPGAAHLYRRRLGRALRRANSTTIVALPAAVEGDGPDKNVDEVVFLGTFDDRKGLPQLLAAWPQVRLEHPAARLTIVGQGRYEAEARAAAAAWPGVEVVLDPPRAIVHRILARGQVLVLASQPSPTWREQVGLPIVEGLQHGMTVVATEQTGLADWLDGHGHVVVRGGDALADGIVSALRLRRPAADVRADLPERDGRVAADDYLMAASNP